MLCNDLRYAENMSEYINNDNVYAVTLKPSCEHWYAENKLRMEERLQTYLKRIKGDYCLFPESVDGNLHYHGIILCEPNNYLLLRRWWNKNFGHIHVSVKLKTPDGYYYNNGWEQYCKKFINNCPQQVDNKIYMF